MADKIVVLQSGRVEQVGSPLELYHRPANLFVAGFIGSPRMNLLPAKVGGETDEGVAVELRDGERLMLPRPSTAVQPGQPVTLGIRPEALRPDPTGPLAGEVRMVERLGGLTLLHVVLAGGQPLVVQIEGSDPTRAHTPIRLSVASGACHLFDAEGQALPALHQHPLAA